MIHYPPTRVNPLPARSGTIPNVAVAEVPLERRALLLLTAAEDHAAAVLADRDIAEHRLPEAAARATLHHRNLHQRKCALATPAADATAWRSATSQPPLHRLRKLHRQLWLRLVVHPMHLRSLKSPTPDRTPMARAGQLGLEKRLAAYDERLTAARARRPCHNETPVPQRDARATMGRPCHDGTHVPRWDARATMGRPRHRCRPQLPIPSCQFPPFRSRRTSGTPN